MITIFVLQVVTLTCMFAAEDEDEEVRNYCDFPFIYTRLLLIHSILLWLLKSSLSSSQVSLNFTQFYSILLNFLLNSQVWKQFSLNSTLAYSVFTL